MKNKKLETFKNIIKTMPTLCGVYIFKDAEETFIYIGKALNIRSRLTSYLSDFSLRVKALFSDTEAIDCIIVQNEYECLLLENNLIKKHKPRYNVKLKDQKTYPLIRITNEDYPRVFKTRQRIEDGSLYYGPYPDVKRIDSYLKIIFQLFHVRKCKGVPLKKRKDPCLYHHMHQCDAPCCKKIDIQTYNQEIKYIKKILEGGSQQFLSYLKDNMDKFAHMQEYELAAQYRDAIQTIKLMDAEQSVEDNNQIARDYISYAGNHSLYRFVVLSMRGGKMLQKSSFQIHSPGNEPEVLEEFILQYYSNLSHNSHNSLPECIFIENFPNHSTIKLFLKNICKMNIEFCNPKKSNDLSMLRMALNNATLDMTHDTHREGALVELQTTLNLSRPPRRIIGFDISQLSGYFTVASIVSFFDGMPDYHNYRTFRIKSIDEGVIDDFKSLSEAVARYCTRLINTKSPLPDLILIDGGKGQLSAVNSIIEALNLSKKVSIISLAKREELIFTLFQSEPIKLVETSPALRLCQAIRDETHRHAIFRNKKLRGKNLLLQHLERIPGIGPKKAKNLLTEYTSLDFILQQTPENIKKIAKISLERTKILLTTLAESYKKENLTNVIPTKNKNSLEDLQ